MDERISLWKEKLKSKTKKRNQRSQSLGYWNKKMQHENRELRNEVQQLRQQDTAKDKESKGNHDNIEKLLQQNKDESILQQTTNNRGGGNDNDNGNGNENENDTNNLAEMEMDGDDYSDDSDWAERFFEVRDGNQGGDHGLGALFGIFDWWPGDSDEEE